MRSSFRTRTAVSLTPQNYRFRVLKALADKLGIPKLNFQILRRTIQLDFAVWHSCTLGISEPTRTLRLETCDGCTPHFKLIQFEFDPLALH